MKFKKIMKISLLATPFELIGRGSVRAGGNGEDLEDVLGRVMRRREVLDVRLQQMSAQLLGEIRAKRIRPRFSLAKVALVDRLTWMQIRRQHVLPEILLRTHASVILISKRKRTTNDYMLYIEIYIEWWVKRSPTTVENLSATLTAAQINKAPIEGRDIDIFAFLTAFIKSESSWFYERTGLYDRSTRPLRLFPIPSSRRLRLPAPVCSARGRLVVLKFHS